MTRKASSSERVIYGVDIQERAVEICKLRLWLSLMVDLDIGEDVNDCSVSAFRNALKRKVTPLPNLDYKIRRADPLVDRIHGEYVNFANIDPCDKTLPPILNRLTSAKREFYTAHKLKDKRRIRFETAASLPKAFHKRVRARLTGPRRETIDHNTHGEAPKTSRRKD